MSQYKTSHLIKDVYKYVRPYGPVFWFGSFSRLTSDLAALYFDIAVAGVVTYFAGYAIGDSFDPLLRILFFWLVCLAVFLLGHYAAKYFVYLASEKAALDAGLDTTKHMFKLDIAWHHRENTGNKIKRILKGQDGVNNILRMWVDNYIEIAVRFIGITIIFYYADPFISLTLAGFIIVYFLISVPLSKKASSAANIVNIEEEKMTGLAFEGLNNVRTVKALNIARRIVSILKSQLDFLYGKIKKRIFWYRSRSFVLDIFSTVFQTAMGVFVILGILEGRYEIGFFVLFIQYYRRVRESVRELADVSQDFAIAKYGVQRMKMILDEPIRDTNGSYLQNFPQDWNRIEIKNLSFSYGRKEVLKDISFSISKGEKVGIVGISGVGKSTLFKLFLKEHENYQGSIYFDGAEIRRIRADEYFNRVSVVLQDTEVFNMSLKDNIAIVGPEKIDEEFLRQAIAVSNVDDFLPKLPNGLDTVIGEKGVKLSGGERQRLGIARAIYKKPDILFLDEATSHLDADSETKIRESLSDFFKNVTAVVIAHRLATVKQMDKIIVLENGQIAESGSFDELYQKKGIFYDLCEKQRL